MKLYLQLDGFTVQIMKDSVQRTQCNVTFDVETF